jgi:hypothetical protein
MALVACTDDDDDFVQPSPADAMAGQGADVNRATDSGDAAPDDVASDGSVDDGAFEDDASDDGPGGDGSLVLGGDGAAADGLFRLQTPAGTNLLSSSDVRPGCRVVTLGPVGNYLLTCEERAGQDGPCRTIEVAFRVDPESGPRTGEVYPAIIKNEPAIGEAVVRYRESVDCTPASTNGWTQVQAGGDLTVDTGGDTAMVFTLNNVSMGPAPRGPLNQNAQGTFALGGSGKASGMF